MEATNETGTNPAGAQSSATGATLSGGLERALVPIGYLNLWEGGYNHEEIPTFTREPQTMASLPGNYTHCWPVYDLAAILAAVELERANIPIKGRASARPS